MKTLTLEREALYTGNLILVNQDHPLKKEPEKDELRLIDEKNTDIYLNNRAAVMLAYLISSIGGQGKIIPVSGYRRRQEQREIYESTRKERGLDFAKKFVALPDCSEHQTGLAVDLAEWKENIDWICPDFPFQGICQNFREKASKFGFIQRYEAGKEEITKIQAEPWHFRYVGYPHSEIIKNEGLSLEEYTEFLKAYPMEGVHYHHRTSGREIEIFYRRMGSGEKTMLKLPGNVPYIISGNNDDGLVITLWK